MTQDRSSIRRYVSFLAILLFLFSYAPGALALDSSKNFDPEKSKEGDIIFDKVYGDSYVIMIFSKRLQRCVPYASLTAKNCLNADDMTVNGKKVPRFICAHFACPAGSMQTASCNNGTPDVLDWKCCDQDKGANTAWQKDHPDIPSPWDALWAPCVPPKPPAPGTIGSSSEICNPLCSPKCKCNVTIIVLISRIINTFLGIAGALALLVFLYAGVTYMVAGSDTERLKRATSTMKYGFIGLTIISLAYVLASTFLNLFIKG